MKEQKYMYKSSTNSNSIVIDADSAARGIIF